jgi:hypothetical protein
MVPGSSQMQTQKTALEPYKGLRRVNYTAFLRITTCPILIIRALGLAAIALEILRGLTEGKKEASEDLGGFFHFELRIGRRGFFSPENRTP